MLVLSGFFGSVGIGPSQQPTAAHRLRVGELMDQTRLGGSGPERPYRQLSDANRDGCMLARALVHDPDGALLLVSPPMASNPGPLQLLTILARPMAQVRHNPLRW